jgi:HlyD family secretion protein
MKSSVFGKIKRWFLDHKKVSFVLLLIFVFAGYKVYASSNSASAEPKYIISTAKKGTIVSSVTGTGQVSASNQVDVNSEVSGDVISVNVKLGQEVKRGQVIVSIDSRNAQRDVQNAELSLENAKIAYEKALKESQDQAVGSSISDLKKAYDDGYTAVSNAIIDVPDIIIGMDNVIYDPYHSPYFSDTNIILNAGQTALDYKYDAGRTFDLAKKDYESDFKVYKSVKTDSDNTKILSLINQTYSMVKELHSALTGTYNTIDYVKGRIGATNIPPEVASDKTAISGYISKMNSHLSNLSSALTDIQNAEDSATTATMDLKSAELNVSKAEDTLRDAKEALYNHSIRSPFDGVVAKISIENGDKISVNAPVATIITNQKVAEVSLNEVDVSKVKIGQKVSMTFDAIEDLKIDGAVTEVDLLGTVEQGVVSYKVKVAFDHDDERIKTGMSLSASIVNDTKGDVLVVPNSAIKSKGNRNYMEVLDQSLMQSQGASKGITSAVAPQRLEVKLGLSGDEYTEIISGLNEGDKFISRTITATATKTTTTQTPSLFGGARSGASGARQLSR